MAQKRWVGCKLGGASHVMCSYAAKSDRRFQASKTLPSPPTTIGQATHISVLHVGVEEGFVVEGRQPKHTELANCTRAMGKDAALIADWTRSSGRR